MRAAAACTVAAALLAVFHPTVRFSMGPQATPSPRVTAKPPIDRARQEGGRPPAPPSDPVSPTALPRSHLDARPGAIAQVGPEPGPGPAARAGSAPRPSPRRLEIASPEIEEAAIEAPTSAPAPEEVRAADAARLLDTARTAYADGAPARALEALRSCGAACQQGPLAEETMALKVQALAANGNVITAATLGARFVQAYPDSPHLPAILPIVGPAVPGGPGETSAGGSIAAGNDYADPSTKIHTVYEGREGNPADRDRGAWSALVGAEQGGRWTVDIFEAEQLGAGGVRVSLTAGDPSGEAATEQMTLLYSAHGDLLDASPVYQPF
jgi:hypothetical protein